MAEGRFRLRSNVGFATRDGVRLSTDLYLPPGEGPFPTVLMRTPYDNTLAWMRAKAAHYADLGYAVAIQDCRGRFDSDGAYEPFRNEGPDGIDALQWVRAQQWSNGRIGMAGRSYSGWTQWTAATERAGGEGADRGAGGPDAIVPRVMATDLYRGLMWRGGAFNIGVLLTWGLMTSGRSLQTLREIDWVDAFRRLPLETMAAEVAQDIPFWRDWLEHPTRDHYWDGVDAEARLDAVTAPAIVMGGWYDLYADDAPRQFELLRTLGATPEARASRLVMGAWPHSLSEAPVTGGVDFGHRALLDLDLLEERWFDRWLRDVPNGVDDDPPAKLFVMGANEWRDERRWPLRADRVAGVVPALGRERRDAARRRHALHRCARPTSRPTRSCTTPSSRSRRTVAPTAARPRSCPGARTTSAASRCGPTCSCYTSEALARDVEVIGPIRVVLFAATDGADTDWTAKLVDVRPSGFAMNLCDGILRASVPRGFDAERPVEPGAVHRYEIDLMATANVFLAGHRIRLEISSSNFPRFDRNPNTGGPIGEERTVRRARQTVLHAGARASHLVLPIVPASGR